MFTAIRKIVYPEICLFCREKAIEDGVKLCSVCRSNLEYLPKENCPLCSRDYDGFLNCCQKCIEDPPPWEKAESFFYYTGTCRLMIHALKYQKQTEYIPYFAGELKKTGLLAECDHICPVPMHFLKKMWRGFNQVDLLAEELSRLSDVPLSAFLRRQKWRPAQVHLRRRERLRNIVGVFKVVDREKIEGKTILLLDDVMTTGSTLRACSQVLLDAGAAKIFVLTLARG